MSDKASDTIDLENANDQERLEFLIREQRLLATASTIHANRRSTPRVGLQQEIILRTGGKNIRRPTLNLGFGGAQINGQSPLLGGRLLTVALSYEEQWGAAITRVVRVDPDRFSVKFLTQSDEFSAILVELVAPYLPADAWQHCAS